MVDDGLTLTQAAARLGVTERTLRAYIKEGKVAAQKVIGSKGVAVYRVHLGDPTSDPPLDQLVDPLETRGDPPVDPGTEAFIRHIAQLEQTIMELSGRCGWLQAQLEAAASRIRELEAPKPDPSDQAGSETGSHPTLERNGRDSGSQAASEEPKEGPKAETGSEASASPVTSSQEASSGGAFKRFWRWLTQPV